MAEAHSAVAFSVNLESDDLSVFYGENFVAVLKSYLYRSSQKLVERFKNFFHNKLFPNHPISYPFFLAISIGLYQTKSLSRLQNISLIEKIINTGIDHTYKDVLILSVISWSSYIVVNRIFLKRLLSNMSYIYQAPGTSSLSFKIWLFLLKCIGSSKAKLYSYQECLPILPVPSTRKTIERYLKSVHPILSEEEYKKISKLANEFQGSWNARKMEFLLTLKSFWSHNYVTDWWEEYVYLASRMPLISNSNFYGIGPLSLKEKYNTTQSGRAAMLTWYLIKYRDQITSENMRPILVRGAIPMCSSQYERQFNTVRIPSKNIDQLKHYATSNHIVVLYRGRYFKVPIISDGKRLRPCEFEYIFNEILHHESDHCPGEDTLAAFTASNRDFWAECRQKYFSSGLNRYSLDIIEKSAFFLVFEDEEFINFHDLDNQEKVSEELKHFGLSCLLGNGKNRWFDKSFTTIFSTNGQIGLNTEHSWADAPISSQKIEQVFNWELENNMNRTPDFHYVNGKCHGVPDQYLRPQRIKWHFEKECIEKMHVALNEAQGIISDIDLYVLPFTKFGRDRIKTFKMSPDAFVQFSIQAAYFEDMKEFCLTYESSMTRLFRNGRTETVRSCTDKSCEFVKALNNPNLSNKEIIAALLNAGDYHQNLYRDAMTGKGCDRNLFALYIMSKYLKINSPFLDYAISQPWRLSTSQTPVQQCEKSKIISIDVNYGACGGGFGPVSDDGYGVSYIFSGGNLLYFHISSKKSCPKTNSSRFGKTIQEKMLQISKLFE